MTDVIQEGLLAALDAAPDDRVAQSALADWYEEHGEGGAAECLRWVVRNGRRPGYNEAQTTFGKYFWEREGTRPILNDPPAQLPDELWQAVGDNDEPHGVVSFKSYQRPRDAYAALLAGWNRVDGPVPDLVVAAPS
jgi:uncharacterized protein (TIGR02996 family)